MSKWGIEEKETLTAINEIGFSGNILDVAAGDGRFINELLKYGKVTAIDIDKNELESLKDICSIEVVDITKEFPFDNSSYDGMFCTGTLHLFDKEKLSFILKEMTRCLKTGGKMVLDFATDIKRFDKEGNKVVFDGEGNYTLEESITFFKEELKDFKLDIKESTFREDNLEDAGYNSIEGKFLIISGIKND